MLVLTRNKAQSIFIGEEVVVTILGVKGGQVAVGIEAPKNVTILREEVRQRNIYNNYNHLDKIGD